MIRTSCFAILAAFTVIAPVAARQDRANEAQQPAIQARPGGPESAPRTDQTVDVAKGTRLVVSNNAGEVVVRSWDRDQVRVQATHPERVSIDVGTTDNTMRVRARSARGPSTLIDYTLTVPRWMAVNLSGTYLESTIEGTSAEVTVESVHGNIRVVGGSGNVSLRSVEGTITVDKATGKLQATTINEGIRLTNISGDVSAETTNGDIVIENAQTTSLDVSTVNGDVSFNGTMRDGGAYRLTTHGGDLRVGLGGAPNATVFVRTFQGDFTADFPIQLPEGQSAREGSKRFNFTLGSGSARIELQSFNGDIVVARKTVVTAEELRRQRRGVSPRNPPQPPQAPQAAPPKPPKGNYAHGFDWDSFEFQLDPPEVDFDFPGHHVDVPYLHAPPTPPVPPVAPVPLRGAPPAPLVPMPPPPPAPRLAPRPPA